MYFRIFEDDVVMVLMNKNPEAKKISADRFKETIGGYTHWQDVLTQTKGDLASGISVPGKTTLIVELK